MKIDFVESAVDWLETFYYEILIGSGIFLGTFLVFMVFRHVILVRVKKWASGNKSDFDDEIVKSLEKISVFFYLVLALYIPLKIYVRDAGFMDVVDAIFVVLVVLEVIKSVQGLVQYWIVKLSRKTRDNTNKRSTFGGLTFLSNLILWSIGLLLILSNLGINITSLIASLGIGGIAIALAVQNILEDVFASFSIYFDKPFEVGDFVVIGEESGTVRRLGLKTTRITTLQGEELVVSNKELTSCRLRNFKKMEKRRVEVNLQVVYEISLKDLKAVKKVIEGVFKGIKMAEFDRVHFFNFGEYSLDFVLVYHVLSPEYIDYMDVREQVNFAIKEAFDKKKISMAYPTHVEYEKRLK